MRYINPIIIIIIIKKQTTKITKQNEMEIFYSDTTVTNSRNKCYMHTRIDE